MLIGHQMHSKNVHGGTTQVVLEVESPTLADSPARDLLITMVKETIILCKKRTSKIEKKSYFSLK